MKKKICSLLLALLMVVTMLPVTAMGATAQLGDKVITGGKRDFKWPVKGWYGISSCFFDGRSHYAIDIPATEGTAVYAAYDGTVAEVTYNNGSDGGYGNGVLLKHTYKKMSGETITLYSRYAHMSSINVSSGQTVYAGQTVVGKVGGTGNGSVIYANHLDFQILTSSNWRNRRTCSIDPFSNELLELPSGVYTASTSDCCGVGPTGCCCNAYVQAIKKIYATPLTHTCDKGSYVYYEAVHPHYKCYKCSICGKVSRDTSEPTKLTNCEQCYPRTATVTYYNADGAVWTTASRTADTSYTLSASYPTKSGSYFVGWSYTAGASSFDLRPNDTVTLKGSIDLYPVYVTHEQAVSGEEVYIYNISDFDSDGYNISSEDHTVQTRVDNSGWTSWSNYSLTEASASSTQQVRTTTMYRYYYFLCPSCGRHEPFTGKSDCGATISGGAWHEGWFDTPYSSSNYQSFSYTTSKYYTTSLGDGQVWIFSAGNLNDTSVGTTDATGSASVIETGYSTRQWVTKFNTVDRTATAYRITKATLASGTCGENLTWVLEENGTLTISGTGAMNEWEKSWETPWYSYQDNIKTVVIKEGATSIGGFAFSSLENLVSTTIPKSVVEIGRAAFSSSGLISVEIPGNVKSIGVSAFAECANLSHLTIGNGVTNIAGGAFSDCTSLTEVVIPDSVSNIGSYSFEGDTNLASLSIGKGVKDIGKCAFDRCRSLSSVTIPDNVINIGEYAFEGATNLTSVTIGSGVANIGALAFVSCNNLTEFKVSNGNESYLSQNGVLFSKDGKTLISYPAGKSETYYTVPNGVETINAFAFMYCNKLTGVTTGNSVTNIGLKAFFGCENLTNVNLSNGIITIGSEAFSHCYSLININIPKTLHCIDQWTFSSCKKLTGIVIPDSVTEIRSGAFSGCSSLDSIEIPNGVVKIGWYVFQNCSALTHIEIPSTVTSIGTDAFNNCAALTDVYYSGTDTQWNAIEVLDGNASLKNATIHFAQPDPQPPVETSGTIAVSSVRARAGQTITVKVDLSANKGISNMRLQMTYPEGFTLENIQKGNALSSLTFTPPGKLTANPVNFVWDGTEADTSEGCILELTFRVADTVAVGDYSISLSYQKDDVLDGNLEGIDLTLQDGTVSVVEFTRGDIDGDGVIGMKDLGTLRKYFAGGYDAGNFVMEAADLDGDGVVTMKDLGVLRRYLAGGYDINLDK